MKTVLSILTIAIFSMGAMAPDDEKLAKAKPERAETKASQDTPAAAMVNLWVVRFDPALPRDELPFNVQATRNDPIFARNLRRDAKGRVMTTGWASQISIADPIIETGLFRMQVMEGQLQTLLKAPNAGSPPWTVVAAPRLLVQSGQRASVSVGKSVWQLVKQTDGCLKAEEAPGAMEGVTVDLMLAWVKPAEMRFSEITLRSSSVAAREPMADVPLDVGKPIMETRETNLGLTLDQGKIAVIPLPERPDDAPILVFLTASPQK